MIEVHDRESYEKEIATLFKEILAGFYSDKLQEGLYGLGITKQGFKDNVVGQRLEEN